MPWFEERDVIMRWHEYHLEPKVEKCAIEVSRRQDSSYYGSPRLIRLYIAFSTVSKYFVHQRTLTERVDVQPYIFPDGRDQITYSSRGAGSKKISSVYVCRMQDL